VVAGAVGVRAAVVEIAGVAGVLVAGAAEGGTKFCHGFSRIHTDRAARVERPELNHER
jgi:hypothetical protein